jgi:hypothetical protein
MAKQIITLEVQPGVGGMTTVTYVFWFPVTVGKEVPQPSLTKSAYAGASAASLQALQLGQVIEESSSDTFPSSATKAQIQAQLQGIYSGRAAYLASLPPKGQYYGVFFDGTVWSA